MMMMATMIQWKVSCTTNLMPWKTKKAMTNDLPFVDRPLQEMIPWTIQIMYHDSQALIPLYKDHLQEAWPVASSHQEMPSIRPPLASPSLLVRLEYRFPFHNFRDLPPAR